MRGRISIHYISKATLLQYILTVILFAVASIVFLWINTDIYRVKLDCNKQQDSCTLQKVNIFNHKTEKTFLCSDLRYVYIKNEDVLHNRRGRRCVSLYDAVYIKTGKEEPIKIYKDRRHSTNFTKPYANTLKEEITAYIQGDENLYSYNYRQSDEILTSFSIFACFVFLGLLVHICKSCFLY